MTSPLKFRDLRTTLFEACKSNQQSVIEDLVTRIRDILEPSGLGNEEEYDNSTLEQDSQRMAEVSALNELLRENIKESQNMGSIDQL